MTRLVRLLAPVFVLTLLAAPAPTQPRGKLVSEPLVGEIEGEPVTRIWYGNNGPATLRTGEVKLNLRSGKRLEVRVTVKGTGRTVVADLKDVADTVVAGTVAQAVRETRLVVGEVNARGEYTLLIGSNQVGDFEVQVSGDAVEGFDVKALEARLAHLNKEIAGVEERLKKLKAKK